MKLLKQPTETLCGPTSLAMLLNQPLDRILEILGHDGSELIWPELPHPRCCRGFFQDELIDVADYFGFGLMEIEAQPLISPNDELPPITFDRTARFPDIDSRIMHYMRKYDGLIIGRYSLENGHMVAWDHSEGVVYDPYEPRAYNFEMTEARIHIDAFMALFESNHVQQK